MFYTKVARVLAGIGLVLGVLMFSFGFALAIGSMNPDVDPSVRKLTGQWIDYGIYMICVSIVLGVLSDISRSLTGGKAGGKLEPRE